MMRRSRLALLVPILTVNLSLVAPSPTAIKVDAASSDLSEATAQALTTDAENYAAYWGVRVDEATRRLQRQDSIGRLNADLEAQSPPWFSGLWIEHQPYAVVVGFVGPQLAAEAATLGGQLDSYMVFRQRDVTLRELRQTARDARALLDPSTSDVDIDLPGGRVVISTYRS